MRSERVKRVVDAVSASLALAVASPVMAAVAVAVRIDLGGPVLFRQQRPGLHGKPFELFKFRTMRDAQDRYGAQLSDAQRLTRLGRWLRATSLDELPELWNVVKGQMSLVGPRPLLMEYLPLYSNEQRRRHDVRPGITGWAQINGRNALSWEEKFRLDCWYVDHWSNQLDLMIVVKTLLAVVRSDGIGHGQEPTMPNFKGNASTS